MTAGHLTCHPGLGCPVHSLKGEWTLDTQGKLSNGQSTGHHWTDEMAYENQRTPTHLIAKRLAYGTP